MPVEDQGSKVPQDQDQKEQRVSRRRLRNRSGKTHRNPDFVYDDDDGEEELQWLRPKPKHKGAPVDQRFRSVSWCGTRRAAVVERKIPDNKIIKDTKRSKFKTNRKPIADEDNLSDSCNSKSEGFVIKQSQLRQQRISAFLKDENQGPEAIGAELDESEDKEIIFKGAETIEADSEASVTEYLKCCGSDLDSLTTGAEYASVASELNPSASSQQINTMAAEGDSSVNNYEQEWKRLLEETKVQLTNSIDSVRTDLTNSIDQLRTEKNTLATDLKSVQNQLKVCQLQLNEVTGVVIRKDQELQECKTEIDQIRTRLDDNILKISGIVESKGEDCKKQVAAFFKNIMQIKGDIAVYDAHRIGKGDNRAMRIVLQNPRDKGRIYANASNLKDVKNNLDKSYFLYDQLTAKKKAHKDRQRQLFGANKNMSVAEQLDMQFKKGELLIENQPYVKSIKPPSCREILQASREVRVERLNQKLERGEIVNVEGQKFIGYSYPVKTLKEVNVAYAKVRAIHTDARHCICACRLAGRDFHNKQEYFEDDEHNAGQFLLKLLEESDIMNRVLVVARIYDGTHIGERRFRAMRDAAASAVDKSSHNPITDCYDTIWFDNGEGNVVQYGYQFTFGRTNIRGRGRGISSGVNRQSIAQAATKEGLSYADVARSPVKEVDPMVQNNEPTPVSTVV